MPLPSELIERLADPQARRELGRMLDALAGAAAFRVERGEWTPTWTGLTVVGTPTYAGRWMRLGPIVFYQVVITAGGANTTASTAGTTAITNLPFRAGAHGTLVATSREAVQNLGVGVLAADAQVAYTPTWGATNNTIVISGWYEAG